MPIEQRVVAPKKIGGGKIGAKKGLSEPEPTKAEKPKKAKGGKKKLVVLVAAVLVVAVAAAAAYFLVLAPGGDDHADAPPRPVAVVQFEARSLNLADGHYLRLGIALELAKTEGGHGGGGDLDAAPALDAAIAVFSGRTVAEVTDPETREQLRAELLTKVQEYYGADVVMGVKFSDYVTQ
ncbi:MAG: flagellar basal body-associated FliL family protein [Micrococcales bacterium]|nr:flagellar basal body-associated FliL family protein [Micrococcales bacterium]